MIPKKIHYCWFGGAPMSPFIKKCMETWTEHLPDYELVLWDESSFDLNSVPFVKQAYEAKKWAFVADYVRFYALYTQGGLYLDTDVKVLRPFPEEWLQRGFFSAHEVHPGNLVAGELNEHFLPVKSGGLVHGISILSAIMGAKKQLPFIKDCLDSYKYMKFLDGQGEMLDVDEIIIGQVLAKVAIKYGYKFHDVKMIIENDMLVLPSNVLVGNAIHLNDESFAIHLVNGSWTNKSKWDSLLYYTRNHSSLFFAILNFVNKVRLKINREVKKIFSS